MTSLLPLFIVNPTSGAGRTRHRWPRLADAIADAGIQPEAVFTERVGHGSELAARAIAEGRRTLIAVGGDGTVNEVVSAVLGAGLGDEVRVGTIGMGTGKDVAKCLGMGRPRAAIRAIAAGGERRIDAGRVVCRDAEGAEVVRFFVLEASAGWVPEISHSVPRRLKRLGETAPYVIMTFAKMIGPMAREFSVSIDGVPFDGRYNSISVHNMEMWGGDLTVVPGALPDDGLFDVLRWGDLGRLAVLKAVQGQRDGGRHLEMEGIDHHGARVVEIDADRRSEIDIDGELAGFLPLRVTMLPGAVRFIAPPPAPAGS